MIADTGVSEYAGSNIATPRLRITLEPNHVGLSANYLGASTGKATIFNRAIVWGSSGYVYNHRYFTVNGTTEHSRVEIFDEGGNYVTDVGLGTGAGRGYWYNHGLTLSYTYVANLGDTYWFGNVGLTSQILRVFTNDGENFGGTQLLYSQGSTPFFYDIAGTTDTVFYLLQGTSNYGASGTQETFFRRFVDTGSTLTHNVVQPTFLNYREKSNPQLVISAYNRENQDHLIYTEAEIGNNLAGTTNITVSLVDSVTSGNVLFSGRRILMGDINEIESLIPSRLAQGTSYSYLLARPALFDTILRSGSYVRSPIEGKFLDTFLMISRDGEYWSAPIYVGLTAGASTYDYCEPNVVVGDNSFEALLMLDHAQVVMPKLNHRVDISDYVMNYSNTNNEMIDLRLGNIRSGLQ